MAGTRVNIVVFLISSANGDWVTWATERMNLTTNLYVVGDCDGLLGSGRPLQYDVITTSHTLVHKKKMRVDVQGTNKTITNQRRKSPYSKAEDQPQARRGYPPSPRTSRAA